MLNWLKSIWNSLWRVGWPRDERASVKAMLSSLLLHLHPPKIRPESLKFRATWAAGLVSLVLALQLTVTGIYLMFYYIPHPDAAWRSMKDLAFVVPLGTLTRNAHPWAAHAMVAIVTVHMLRVYMASGYKGSRQANWVAGVALWFLTLALSFTGYLLPWDQLAYWAVTVGSNMAAAVPLVGDHFRQLILGDRSVGESALLRFYVLHCVALPAILFLIVGFHLFRVRKDGGLVVSEHAPGGGRGDEGHKLVPAWPHLVYRELIVTLVVTATLLALALWLQAPLEAEADPSRTPNPAKAPWYFLGVQELAHYSAFWGGVFVPAATLLGLALLPYLDTHAEGVGRYLPKERRIAQALFAALLLFMAVTTVVGTLFRGPAWALMWWPK